MLRLGPGIIARRVGAEGGYDVLEVFIGPQHPASGHMRLIVRLDGDVIVSVDPDIGYVHRTMEKLAETREYVRIIPLLERMTIIDSCNVTLPLVEAMETLLGVEPPPRSVYLRTLLCEVNRIASHLYGLGIGSVMLNHSTMYMWAFGDREVWLTIAERLTGARLTHTYILPGGVRRDMPQGLRDDIEKACRYMERRLKEYEKIFLRNPVVESRLSGVGVLKASRAIELGVVGPNLRASGVRYDVRMIGYAAYGDIGFEPVVGSEGDCLERIRVRIEEIKASISIIRGLLKQMPEGPFFSERFTRLLPPKLRRIVEEEGRIKLPGMYVRLRPRNGRVIRRGEAARGEITYYLEARGGFKPYRVRVVTPSARNVVLFRELPPGHRLMDLPAIYASIDYFPPEADR